MNRREFTKKAIGGIALLSGLQPLEAISKSRYLRLTDDGIAFRFIVASDGHYGQVDTEFDRYHNEMIGWINKEHRSSPLNFSFFNGDLIHDEVSFLPKAKQKYKQLEMPYYVSRGNHDRCDRQTWLKLWGVDLNYHFDIKNNFFIVLDTSNEKGEFICPDVDWLRNTLQKSQSFKNVFVFMHITPKKWARAGFKVDCDEVVNLFGKQDNLCAIFNGHDHKQDHVKIDGGKSYFFDAHFGGSWGTDYRGYRVVEITKSNEIISYQVNPLQGVKVNKDKVR
jgi:3',5'-cyclic-AMP phosphodiesterase